MRGTRQPVRLLPHRSVSGLFLTNDGEYVADIKPDDGTRFVRRFGTDKMRALVLFDALLEELANDAVERKNPKVVAFLNETFLPSQQRLKSFDYTKTRVVALTRFLESRYPNLRIADVRKLHAHALGDYYADRSPRTRNGNLQKLKQAMNVAIDLDLLPANPLARYKGLRFDNRRIRVCDMDEFVAVVDAARGDVRDIVVVLGLTGLRPSNAFALRKDEIRGDTIQIPPEKMKNARWGVIPISAFVADLLRKRIERSASESVEGSDYVFPSPKRSDAPYGSIKKAWSRLVRVTGLDWLQVYDLRHFYASQLAKMGATEQQIGRLLCHVGQSVTSRYVHHDLDDLRPFVERLSAVFVERYGEACGLSREQDSPDAVTSNADVDRHTINSLSL
jgi:integrase